MKAVIFDMDGVLFDTERLILSVWCEIAEAEHIPNMKEVLLECIGRSRKDVAIIFEKHYGKAFDYTGFRERADNLFDEFVERNDLPVKTGVYEILEFLKAKQYKVGLASSTRKESILSHLKRTGLENYFEVIIGGDMVAQSKPHPEIYLKACEGLSVRPDECFCIEDSINGILSAYAAGLKTIMVPDLLRPTEEINKKVYREFASLLEVKHYLETLME